MYKIFAGRWLTPAVREATANRVGFDMRHHWTEVVEIAPSDTLEKFSRKQVSNDYPLFALWQVGAGLMRTTTSDLEDSGRQTMENCDTHCEYR